jgi:hypothetical protein
MLLSRTFNMILSIHLYTNGALSETLTPRPGWGRLSKVNAFEDTAFNSGVDYNFLPPLTRLRIKYRDAVLNSPYL